MKKNTKYLFRSCVHDLYTARRTVSTADVIEEHCINVQCESHSVVHTIDFHDMFHVIHIRSLGADTILYIMQLLILIEYAVRATENGKENKN